MADKVKNDEKLSDKIKVSANKEKAKLKEMSFKEKREYIGEYYKIPIISVIIMLAVGYSILDANVLNPPKKTYAYIAFLDRYVDTTIEAEFKESLSQALVDDYENYEIQSTSFYIPEDDPEMAMAMSQRFVAMVAAKEIDVLIMNESEFEDIVSEGYLMSFDEIEGLDGVEGNDLSKYGDNLLTGALKDKPEDRQVYGISIIGNEYIKSFGINPQNTAIGVVVNSNRINAALEAIDYIYNWEPDKK